MRASIRAYVELISQTLPVPEPIYEFGALQVEGQEGYADLRPFFPGKQYVGCDMREGPGVDKVLDLHNLDLPDDCVGTALMFDTLEHVEYPHKAVEEVYRVLRPGGVVYMSSVMNFPIHCHPYDYWRFTPEAFNSLLKPFANSLSDYAGEDLFPHTVVGIGIKGEAPDFTSYNRGVEVWKKDWFYVEGFSWKVVKRMIVPTILQGKVLKKLKGQA